MNESTSSVNSDHSLEKQFNILIVDDNSDIVALLKEILNLKFPLAKVHTAYNGAKALEVLNNLIIKGITIDFVLTEHVMPIMNGAELCKLIKKIHPNVKNAIMTCSLPAEDEKILPFDEIILKPIDFNALFKRISDQMKNKRLSN